MGCGIFAVRLACPKPGCRCKRGCSPTACCTHLASTKPAAICCPAHILVFNKVSLLSVKCSLTVASLPTPPGRNGLPDLHCAPVCQPVPGDHAARAHGGCHWPRAGAAGLAGPVRARAGADGAAGAAFHGHGAALRASLALACLLCCVVKWCCIGL
jgi:hypothetical protein